MKYYAENQRRGGPGIRSAELEIWKAEDGKQDVEKRGGLEIRNSVC